MPPQFGHVLAIVSAQSSQKVHSKLQMKAPGCAAGSDAWQRSQIGRISST